MIDDPLKSKPDDELHRLVRGAVGMVPVLGPVLQEMFVSVIADPAQKRRDAFLRDVLERVVALELELEKLKANTNFQCSLIQATQIILRTADPIKIEGLQNAVINSARFENLDDSIRHMFMQHLDRLTGLHIKLLRFMDNPIASEPARQKLSQLGYGGLVNVIDVALPELQGKRDLTQALLNDLEQISLVSGTNLGVTMSGQGLGARRTTELGRAFLTFVSDDRT